MGGLPPDVCCADGPYCSHRYPDIDERDERDEPADQARDDARDDARAIARAILPDFLDQARHCTLTPGRTYRVQRHAAGRLHGDHVPLAVGDHVDALRVLQDLAVLARPGAPRDAAGKLADGADLIAVVLTGDLDPHGWADVFGETTR